MNRHVRWLSLIAVSVSVAGCGTMRSSVVVEPASLGGASRAGTTHVAPARTLVPGGSYVVMKGDTLYSIAFRNGVDFRDLAQWNGIAAPYTIWPGQRLILAPAVATVHPGVPSARSAAAPTAAHAAAPTAPMFEAVPAAPPASPSSTLGPAPATPQVAATPAPHPAASVSLETVPVAGRTVAAPPVVAPALKPVPAGVTRAVSGVHWRWPVDGAVISRFNSGDAIPGIEIGGKSGDPVRAAADGVVVYSGNGLVGYGELVIIKHNDSFLSAYGHNRKRLVKEGEQVKAGQQIAEMGSTGATRDELEFQIRKDGNPVDPLSYLPAR